MRKRRTREHVIADLSVHHVEGFVLRCGWTVERTRHDYGIDLLMQTYNANGELESGRVLPALGGACQEGCWRRSPGPRTLRAAAMRIRTYRSDPAFYTPINLTPKRADNIASHCWK